MSNCFLKIFKKDMKAARGKQLLHIQEQRQDDGSLLNRTKESQWKDAFKVVKGKAINPESDIQQNSQKRRCNKNISRFKKP